MITLEQLKKMDVKYPIDEIFEEEEDNDVLYESFDVPIYNPILNGWRDCAWQFLTSRFNKVEIEMLARAICLKICKRYYYGDLSFLFKSANEDFNFEGAYVDYPHLIISQCRLVDCLPYLYVNEDEEIQVEVPANVCWFEELDW